MGELIPLKVTSNSERVTVSARELHDALQIQTDYPHWFDRMTEYGFVEGEDFQTFLTESTGGRPGKDAQITIEMAKQICMIQRTDIGKQYREYFLQLEKEWNSPEKVMARALDYAHKTIAELTLKAEEMKPKALFADAVSASDDCILMRDLAKLIKQNGVDIGGNRLWDWMREHEYICKGSTQPTQLAMDMGLFHVIERTIQVSDGSPRIKPTTKVTGKGQQYFINKFLGENHGL
jgi:anti-repressor protein